MSSLECKDLNYAYNIRVEALQPARELLIWLMLEISRQIWDLLEKWIVLQT